MVAALIIIGTLAVIFPAVWMVRWGRPSHLVGPLKTLPASGFPERADVYTCDKCARDVTKHLRLRRSHSWTPMGLTRFVRRCGQRYLTGAIEWVHLGRSERHRRVCNRRSDPSSNWVRPVLLGIGFFFPGFVFSLPLIVLWARHTWPDDGKSYLGAIDASFYVGVPAAFICCAVLFETFSLSSRPGFSSFDIDLESQRRVIVRHCIP